MFTIVSSVMTAETQLSSSPKLFNSMDMGDSVSHSLTLGPYTMTS